MYKPTHTDKASLKSIIQSDLNSIKLELIENSRVFIKYLFDSLRFLKGKPFSAYKVDLSLSFLKKIYETAFPSVKHGGLRDSKSKQSKNNPILNQVAPSVTCPKNTSLLHRSIIINLLEGINTSKGVPSFVELVKTRSELSSTAIQNRIRAGNFIINCSTAISTISLFRNNRLSHTKFLEEMPKKKLKSK